MRLGTQAVGSVVVAGALALVASWGCGLKARPRPPELTVPQAPSALRLEPEATGVKVSCAVPERNSDGSALTDLEAIEFHRAGLADTDCPTCPVSFSKVGEVAYSYSPGEPMPKGRVSLLDELERAGLYRYRAVARNAEGRTGKASAAREIYWDVPPARVEGLDVRVGDQRVELRWSPVLRTADGKSLPAEQVAYQVFRSKEGASFGMAPLNPTPIAHNSFTDIAVQNQVSYLYKVRAVRKVGERTVPGPFSEVLQAMPRRLEPPGPPHGLVGFPTATGVRLVWEGGPGKGVSGYRIYRASSPQGPWEQIGADPAVVPFMDDPRVQPGRTYWYSVSTLDDSVPPMEGERSQPVRVHVPSRTSPGGKPGT